MVEIFVIFFLMPCLMWVHKAILQHIPVKQVTGFWCLIHFLIMGFIKELTPNYLIIQAKIIHGWWLVKLWQTEIMKLGVMNDPLPPLNKSLDAHKNWPWNEMGQIVPAPSEYLHPMGLIQTQQKGSWARPPRMGIQLPLFNENKKLLSM